MILRPQQVLGWKQTSPGMALPGTHWGLMRILITTQGSLPSAINRNRLEVRKEIQVRLYWGPCYSFPDSSDGKECTHNGGDPGSIPGSGRSPGGGYDSPLQYPCLKNSTDRGAWRAIVHGDTKSWTQLRDSAQQIPLGNCVCFLYLWLYFYFVNRFMCNTIFF